MTTLRAPAALALALAAAALAGAPAAADPAVIPAPDYVPRAAPRADRYVDQYYDDGYVVRRVSPREARGGRYEDDLFDDPADRVYRYDGLPRRIPSQRARSVYRGDDAYESYVPPRRLDREGRIYRYYDDPRYEPYETREPTVEPDMPRRYAGPPSGTGADQPIGRAIDPKFARTVVPYNGPEPAHSIVINTKTRYLYLINGDGTAIRYGVGVGKEGFAWSGTETITDKKEWPEWRPPAEMRQRRPELPILMAGGPDNPLGARALYLGHTLYRIHGSNEPWTIGHAVSSGCIRMTNEDVIDLYERVGIGTIVKVI